MDLDVVVTATALTLAQLLPPLVLTVAAVVMAIWKCPQWTVMLGRALSVLVVISWLAYWILWSVAFSYVDAYQPVPASVEISQNTALVLGAAGSVAVLSTAVAGVALSFRARRTVSMSSSR